MTPEIHQLTTEESVIAEQYIETESFITFQRRFRLTFNCVTRNEMKCYPN